MKTEFDQATMGMFSLADLTVHLRTDISSDELMSDAIIHEIIHFLQTLGTTTGIYCTIQRFTKMFGVYAFLLQQGNSILRNLPVDLNGTDLNAIDSIVNDIEREIDSTELSDCEIHLAQCRFQDHLGNDLEDRKFFQELDNKKVGIVIGTKLIRENNAANLTKLCHKLYNKNQKYEIQLPNRGTSRYDIVGRYLKPKLIKVLPEGDEAVIPYLQNLIEFLVLMNAIPGLMPFRKNMFDGSANGFPLNGNLSLRKSLLPNATIGFLFDRIVKSVESQITFQLSKGSNDLFGLVDSVCKKAGLLPIAEQMTSFRSLVSFQLEVWTSFLNKMGGIDRIWNGVPHFLNQALTIAERMCEEPYLHALGFEYAKLVIQTVKNLVKVNDGETLKVGELAPEVLDFQIEPDGVAQGQGAFTTHNASNALLFLSDILYQACTESRIYCIKKLRHDIHAEHYVSWCENFKRCKVGFNSRMWPYDRCCPQFRRILSGIFLNFPSNEDEPLRAFA